ncbi:hypothetical protein M885DRAFT_540405 [Pelagophyceae sp. CCMP2097]|nr:hypothetical protein M885DRAFT_540405 [Pelagophyceae sp. CCMP2097]
MASHTAFGRRVVLALLVWPCVAGGFAASPRRRPGVRLAAARAAAAAPPMWRARAALKARVLGLRFEPDAAVALAEAVGDVGSPLGWLRAQAALHRLAGAAVLLSGGALKAPLALRGSSARVGAIEVERGIGGALLRVEIGPCRDAAAFRRATRDALRDLDAVACAEARPIRRLPRPLPRGAGDGAVERRGDEFSVVVCSWPEDAVDARLGWDMLALVSKDEIVSAADGTPSDGGGWRAVLTARPGLGEESRYTAGLERNAGAVDLVLRGGADLDDGLVATVLDRWRRLVATPPPVATQPNVATAWASAIIDELVRCGVAPIVVCPGSRSTPLALAAQRHPGVDVVVIHDERAAAFYALGAARAGAACGAVIVTSGTAALNLLPAAAEASEDDVPLLLVTADRPNELRGVGADQALPAQAALLRGLGDGAARWVADLAPPDDRVAALGELGEIGAAVRAAMADASPGPAQINVALRENLAPRSGPVRGDSGARRFSPRDKATTWDKSCLTTPIFVDWEARSTPLADGLECRYVSYGSHGNADSSGAYGGVVEAAADLARGRSGVVVLGELRGRGDRAAVAWLLGRLGWPVVHADCRSGLRAALEESGLGVRRAGAVLGLVGEVPDVVLQLGSKPLPPRGVKAWLDAAYERGAKKVVVGQSPRRVDDDGATTSRVYLSPGDFASACETMGLLDRDDDGRARGAAGPSTLAALSRLSLAADDGLEAALAAPRRQAGAVAAPRGDARGDGEARLIEPLVARLITAACADGTPLFISNSMSIRDHDAYGDSRGLANVAANRGLAGIDGILATAVGFAEFRDVSARLGAPPGEAPGRRSMAVIGDQALLHDASSMRVFRDAVDRGLKLVVVAVNNGGGAIFSFLPIGERKAQGANGEDAEWLNPETEFERLFGAPHNVDLEALAKAFGVPFKRCTSPASLRRALRSQTSLLVEAVVSTSREANVDEHKELNSFLTKATMRAVVGDRRRVGVANLASTTFAAREASELPPLVLLHGLFGSNADFDDDLVRALSRRRRVIAIELPGHGRSGPAEAEAPESVVYSFESTIEAVCAVLDRSGVGAVDILGYSFGARLALGIKRAMPHRVRRVVAVSANVDGADSLSAEALQARADSDGRVAQQIEAALRDDAAEPHGGAWRRFLDEWYDAQAKRGMWKPLRANEDAYAACIDRRLRHTPHGAAASLRYCGQTRSPSLYEALDADVLYVYGADDAVCAGIAGRLPATPAAPPQLGLAGAGHAVLDEAPRALEAAAVDFFERDAPAAAGSDEACVVITDVCVTTFDLPRAGSRPPPARYLVEQASRGAPAPPAAGAGRLRGALITLGSAAPGAADHVGIGEAAPCAGVHAESADEATAELRRAAAKLRGALIPARVVRLDGSLAAFLQATVGEMSPTVRFALECAVLDLCASARGGGLSAQHAGAVGPPGRGGAASSVGIATLVDGDVGSAALAGTVKVKIGADPEADAARCCAALRAGAARVRADANRKWAAADFARFEAALQDLDVRLEFVEEPLRDGESAVPSDRAPYALDESVAEFCQGDRDGGGDSSPAGWPAADSADEAAWRSSAALVVKPSVVGVERAAAVVRAARARGCAEKVVISSCFEAGVGLGHLAAFAAAVDNGRDHGLGTFAWLHRDVLRPPLKQLVADSAGTASARDDARRRAARPMRLDVHLAEAALRDAAARFHAD